MAKQFRMSDADVEAAQLLLPPAGSSPGSGSGSGSGSGWFYCKLLGHSFLMVSLLVLSMPLLASVLWEESSPSTSERDSISTNNDLLPVLFRDLTNEGLIKLGDKSLFLCGPADQGEGSYDSLVVGDRTMDLISVSDLERQSSFPETSFDLAFSRDFGAAAATFIDRTLKIGGIAVVQLRNQASVVAAFDLPFNYKIVYLRRFDSTVIALRKTEHSQTRRRRRLCGMSSEVKKAALKKLEAALLEPPHAETRKSSSYLKRTKYLPDLTGDSLESYPRRVFIQVGTAEEEGKSMRWFSGNYPTRNRKFEMYRIETGGKEEAEMGMSEWLRENVKEEEYVVMKAEAEVVEEMVKSKAIGLVDELFMECKPDHDSLHNNRKSKMGKRAYWECLALYGQLRDQGVAVHQWWS